MHFQTCHDLSMSTPNIEVNNIHSFNQHLHKVPVYLPPWNIDFIYRFFKYNFSIKMNIMEKNVKFTFTLKKNMSHLAHAPDFPGIPYRAT